MKVLMKDSREIVEATAGYARNYLFPRGLAEPVTKRVLVNQADQKAKQKAEVAKQKEADFKLAAKLNGKSIKFELKTTEAGKLHGSVTTIKIARRLKISKESVNLSKPIKKEGKQQIQLRFGQSRAKIWVIIAALAN